ncbi:Protein C50F4.8 [Aphelenchoides avenae]|nr:Protein C50F4.8 [Aphelenchus avenae]
MTVTAIQSKFGCLGRIDKDVSQQCLKTCTSHHNAVTSLMQNFKHLALNGDSTQAENYLAESCEYVTCTLHCDIPTIAHICDFETADLVINLTKKSFASMEQMALDTGAVSRWPHTCSDIKTYALPKAKE